MRIIFLTVLLSCQTACTVATPDVKKLFSSLNGFRLTQNDISMPSVALLSSVVVNASCNSFNLGFEYELPSAPGTWVTLPTAPVAPFISITNDCATTNSLQIVMNLSGVSPFSTMSPGQTQTIRFRDVNTLGAAITEEFRIRYTLVTLSDDRLVYGQGFNNTKAGSTHLLQGRVIGFTRQQNVPGSSTHTLEGRIILE